MTALVGAAAVVLAAFIKGAIGFGFPTVATPALALVFDVKTAVAVLILPNIVMDGAQLRRVGRPLAALRELGVLIVFGGIGTVLGTWLLVGLSGRAARLILGLFVVIFVVSNLVRRWPRLSERSGRWLAAPAGLVSGIVGGVTNSPATPVVIYVYSLGWEKRRFVRGVALVFFIYKVIQLGAVTWYGLMTWRLLTASAVLSVVAVVTFALGLRLQDRLDPVSFRRAILVFLSLVGVSLVVGGVL